MVDYTELTGADLYVSGHIGPHPVTVRLDRATAARPGDRLPLAFRLTDLSLFDRASGNRL